MSAIKDYVFNTLAYLSTMLNEFQDYKLNFSKYICYQ